jgi:hypothetical protein
MLSLPPIRSTFLFLHNQEDRHGEREEAAFNMNNWEILEDLDFLKIGLN